MVVRIAPTLGLSNAEDVREQFTLLFASTGVASWAVRFLLIYAIAKFNYGIGHELGA